MEQTVICECCEKERETTQMVQDNPWVCEVCYEGWANMTDERRFINETKGEDNDD